MQTGCTISLLNVIFLLIYFLHIEVDDSVKGLANYSTKHFAFDVILLSEKIRELVRIWSDEPEKCSSTVWIL